MPRRTIAEVPVWHKVCLTVAEAAALISKAEDYLYEEIKAGWLRPTPGTGPDSGEGYTLIHRQELERWASPDHGRRSEERDHDADESRFAAVGGGS
jgi:hypothetical protein